MQRIHFTSKMAEEARQRLAIRKDDVYARVQELIDAHRIPNAEYGAKRLTLSEDEVGKVVDRMAVQLGSSPRGKVAEMLEGPSSLSAIAGADASPFTTRTTNRTKFSRVRKSILDYEYEDYRSLFRYFMYGRGTVAQTVIFRAMLETTDRFAKVRAEAAAQAPAQKQPAEAKPESVPALLSKVCSLLDDPAFATDLTALVKKHQPVVQNAPTEIRKAGGATTKRKKNHVYSCPVERQRAENMLAELAYINLEKLAPPYAMLKALGTSGVRNLKRWLAGQSTPQRLFINHWNESDLRKKLMPQLRGKLRHLSR